MTKKRTPPKKTSGQSSEPKSAPRLVPQPHGGALVPGAGGGPQPGAGRPPDFIRAQLRGNFADRMAFLNAVIDGDPMQTIEMPLATVLRLATCPHCDAADLKANDPAKAVLQTVKVRVSASVADRIRAIDLQAKYGLGTSNESTATIKDERVLTREEREDRALTLLKGSKTG